MWFVDLGESVWADEPNGDLTMFRWVGPFASGSDAYAFAARYPVLPDVQCHYIRPVTDFTAATPRF